MKEVNEDACYLDMPHGLHGIDYPQKFVKAKSEAPFPCNYKAEEVPVNNYAMKISLGK